MNVGILLGRFLESGLIAILYSLLKAGKWKRLDGVDLLQCTYPVKTYLGQVTNRTVQICGSYIDSSAYANNPCDLSRAN